MTTIDRQARIVASLSGFSDIDRRGDPRRFINYLDRTAQALEEVKARLLDLGALRHAAPWLDLGWGVGHDLASCGGGVGLDPSVSLMTEARRRWHAMRLVAGAGEQLPFAESSFDGCKIERVLQHIHQPSVVLAEVARVLRSGATLVVFEPDWGSLVWNTPDNDIGRSLTDLAVEHKASGRVGRQLGRLLHDAGYVEVRHQPDTVHWRTLDGLRQLFDLDAHVSELRAAAAHPDRIHHWLRKVEMLQQHGELRVSLTRYYGSGVRP